MLRRFVTSADAVPGLQWVCNELGATRGRCAIYAHSVPTVLFRVFNVGRKIGRVPDGRTLDHRLWKQYSVERSAAHGKVRV